MRDALGNSDIKTFVTHNFSLIIICVITENRNISAHQLRWNKDGQA
jgi:hypothetical protein